MAELLKPPFLEGWTEAIVGCMFSGKTEELERLLKRLPYAKVPFISFKHVIDERYLTDFLVTHDKDNSIVDHDVINKNTDMTFIVILLSPDFYMKKGENLIVQLFLSSGIIKTTSLEASLPIRSIVNFD